MLLLSISTMTPASSKAWSLSAARHADGHLEIFYSGVGLFIYHNWQVTPGGSWNGEVRFPWNNYWLITPALNLDGRMEFIAWQHENGIGTFKHSAQTPREQIGWSNIAPIPGASNSYSFHTVARNADGRLELFYVNANTKTIIHDWQTSAGASTWHGPETLPGNTPGGFINSIENRDGRLEIFYTDANTQKIYRNWQTSPNGTWRGQFEMDGRAKYITSAMNKNGRVEIFYVGTNDQIYHNWQTSPGGAWNGEALLGGTAKQIAAAVNQDGRMEIFYVGLDNTLYRKWRNGTDQGGWSSAAAMAQAKYVTAISNQDGRLEIFYIGLDDQIYHNSQKAPNSDWKGAERL